MASEISDRPIAQVAQKEPKPSFLDKHGKKLAFVLVAVIVTAVAVAILANPPVAAALGLATLIVKSSVLSSASAALVATLPVAAKVGSLCAALLGVSILIGGAIVYGIPKIANALSNAASNLRADFYECLPTSQAMMVESLETFGAAQTKYDNAGSPPVTPPTDKDWDETCRMINHAKAQAGHSSEVHQTSSEATCERQPDQTFVEHSAGLEVLEDVETYSYEVPQGNGIPEDMRDRIIAKQQEANRTAYRAKLAARTADRARLAALKQADDSAYHKLQNAKTQGVAPIAIAGLEVEHLKALITYAEEAFKIAPHMREELGDNYESAKLDLQSAQQKFRELSIAAALDKSEDGTLSKGDNQAKKGPAQLKASIPKPLAKKQSAPHSEAVRNAAELAEKAVAKRRAKEAADRWRDSKDQGLSPNYDSFHG